MLNSRPEHRIAPDTRREVALCAFRECVNQPGTIFSTDFWLLPKLDRLRQLMHDPITDDEAAALFDVLYQRRWMRDLMEWLEDEPVSWPGHFIRAKFRAEEAEHRRSEEAEKGIRSMPVLELNWGTPEERARSAAN